MNLQQSDFWLPFISSEKESQYKLADPEPGFQDADKADASEQAQGTTWKQTDKTTNISRECI